MAFSRTLSSDGVLADAELAQGAHHLVGAGQTQASGVVGASPADLLALEEDLSCIRRVDPVDHVEERGLAGAVRADEPQDPVLHEVEADVAERP